MEWVETWMGLLGYLIGVVTTLLGVWLGRSITRHGRELKVREGERERKRDMAMPVVLSQAELAAGPCIICNHQVYQIFHCYRRGCKYHGTMHWHCTNDEKHGGKICEREGCRPANLDEEGERIIDLGNADDLSALRERWGE
jgi:hypothetical protein